MSRSPFRDWFIEQHGNRSHDERDDELLQHAVKAGEWAREELARRTEWDARYQSALYAWNVKDSDKK
jgi:hypothetical protein